MRKYNTHMQPLMMIAGRSRLFLYVTIIFRRPKMLETKGLCVCEAIVYPAQHIITSEIQGPDSLVGEKQEPNAALEDAAMPRLIGT